MEVEQTRSREEHPRKATTKSHLTPARLLMLDYEVKVTYHVEYQGIRDFVYIM